MSNFIKAIAKAFIKLTLAALVGAMVKAGWLDPKNLDPAHLDKLAGFIATIVMFFGTGAWTLRTVIKQRIKMLTGFGMDKATEKQVEEVVKATGGADPKTASYVVPKIPAGKLFR